VRLGLTCRTVPKPGRPRHSNSIPKLRHRAFADSERGALCIFSFVLGRTRIKRDKLPWRSSSKSSRLLPDGGNRFAGEEGPAPYPLDLRARTRAAARAVTGPDRAERVGLRRYEGRDIRRPPSLVFNTRKCRVDLRVQLKRPTPDRGARKDTTKACKASASALVSALRANAACVDRLPGPSCCQPQPHGEPY
jgi:hypothetical protein